MISRRGGSGGGSSQSNHYVVEYIYANMTWDVPTVKNNEFSIRIFGGGGGGGSYYGYGGGGSGWMNNDILTNLIPGDLIQITVGDKLSAGSNTNGLTTSFGTYLSANGGSVTGSGGSGGWHYSCSNIRPAYQFGGGGSYGIYPGTGGVWGGGGASGNAGQNSNGADGGIYGGGGGCAGYNYKYHGGNGGTYGGGGGGMVHSTYSYLNYGRGGTYGGNGGYWDRANDSIGNANNGINTSTWTNVFNDGNGYFRGWGRGGGGCGGGGGFGGNGGACCTTTGVVETNTIHLQSCAFGGGGGYGSTGGYAYTGYSSTDGRSYSSMERCSGGGGG